MMFYRKTIKRANLFIFLTKKIFALFPAESFGDTGHFFWWMERTVGVKRFA